MGAEPPAAAMASRPESPNPGCMRDATHRCESADAQRAEERSIKLDVRWKEGKNEVLKVEVHLHTKKRNLPRDFSA